MKTAALGSWGEDAALRHARWRGAWLLARNYRAPSGELDLVLRQLWTVVFAEVKTRWSDPARGLESITPGKQLRIIQTARHYLRSSGADLERVRCRFDVFLVSPRPETRVLWLKDAFSPDTLPGWAQRRLGG